RGARARGRVRRPGARRDPHRAVRARRAARARARRAGGPDRAGREPAPALGPPVPRARRRVPARAQRVRGGRGDRAAGLRTVTGRTLALVVAALVLPALWGWLVPGLLARAWPRREPPP